MATSLGLTLSLFVNDSSSLPLDDTTPSDQAGQLSAEKVSLLKSAGEEEPTTSQNVLNRPLSPLALVLIGVLAVVVLFLSLGTQQSGYLSMAPGPAPLIEIEGYPRSNEQGQYYFTTIKVEEVDFKTWLWHKVTGDSEQLVPSAGPGSGGSKAASYAQMEQSKILAAQVAASYINPSQSVTTQGVKVLDVLELSPADRAGLEIGDIITSVGAQTVNDESQLSALVEKGDAPLTLNILRASSPLELVVDFEGQPRTLGIQIMTALESELALPITTGSVGGPSGGLMFTIADIDALVGGDLSGGAKIAGTGTITVDGTVGPVGGTDHKVKAAEDAGASVFFVPLEDAELAKGAASDQIAVVPVSSLREAVTYLCQNGGVSPVCTP